MEPRSSTATPKATASIYGKLLLTGDFGGTAASPQVVATHLSSALPLNQGGTAATTAGAARTSLGLGSLAVLSSVDLTANVTGILPIANGGTGSGSQNFVDLSSTQASIAGAKTFTSAFAASGGATLSGGTIINGNLLMVPAVRTGGLTLTTSSPSMELCDATTAPFTITLLTAVGHNGLIFTIKKTDSSVNAVTIATTSSQKIDGASTYSLALQYKYVTLVSDGANWNVIGNN